MEARGPRRKPGCESVQWGVFCLRRKTRTFPREPLQSTYRLEDVSQYFDEKKLKDIILCKCMAKGCCGHLEKTERKNLLDIIPKLQKEHTLTVGILARKRSNMLLPLWIKSGHTDEDLAMHPIQEDDVKTLIKDAFTNDGRADLIAEEFVKEQNAWFFRPVRTDTLEPQSIQPPQQLPLMFDEDKTQRGSTGMVYLGVKPMMLVIGPDGRPIQSFAAKVFELARRTGPDHEIMVAKSLPLHPNVLKPLAILHYKDRGILLYQEAYGDMDKVMKQERSDFTKLDVGRIIAEVESAICHLHTNNIHHLDIKPSNILLQRCGGEWTALLTDCGNSVNWTDGGAGYIPGSSPLDDRAPPENYGGQTSNKTDIWSFGTWALDFLLWDAEGVEGLETFHSERCVDLRHGNVVELSAKPYHNNGEDHAAVLETFKRLEEKHGGDPTRIGVINIVKKTLMVNAEERPSALEVHRLFESLFGSQEASRPIFSPSASRRGYPHQQFGSSNGVQVVQMP